MNVLVLVSPTQRSMFISLRAKSLKPYQDLAVRKGWTWRLHDGNGWAAGSEDAWQSIASITEPCMATIVY